MDIKVLVNPDENPTEEIIFSHIGKSRLIWESLFEFIQNNYPDFSEEWRYYNDGKCWLFKLTKKTKTIFWLSVFKNYFIITFYFSDKAEESILESNITQELKEQFINGKRYGKIRGLSIKMNKKNLEFVKELIKIKLKTK